MYLYLNSQMSKISNLIVFLLLHGLIILCPPTSRMVQAYETADEQAALETTSSRNWNFPQELKSAYPLDKMRGNGIYTKEELKGRRLGYHRRYQPSTSLKIMLALDSSGRQSGTVKIASTKHFAAEVMMKPDRRLGRPTPSSPKPNTFHHYGTPPSRNQGHRFSPPPPAPMHSRMALQVVKRDYSRRGIPNKILPPASNYLRNQGAPAVPLPPPIGTIY